MLPLLSSLKRIILSDMLMYWEVLGFSVWLSLCLFGSDFIFFLIRCLLFLFWNAFDFLELSHRHRHVDTHSLSLLNKRNLFSFYICYRPYISVSKPSLILYFTINHNFPNPKSKRTHTHILLVSTCKQSPAPIETPIPFARREERNPPAWGKSEQGIFVKRP